MPIYEYRCNQCGRNFEKMQRITESPMTDCIFCQGKVRKLISSSSFHLKGSGWYVTDYARKGGTTQGTETPKSEKKAESNSISSTEESSGSASTETAGSSET